VPSRESGWYNTDMIEFEIPGTLTDLNTHLDKARTHWAKAGELKKAETNKVKLIASQYAGQLEEDDFPVDIHCHWVCENRRKDKDNIRFAVKYILDGMEKAGMIENDGWNYVGTLTDSFSVDKENPRVEVEITPSN